MARLLFGTFAARWSTREQVEVGGSERKDKATCVTVSYKKKKKKSRCVLLYICACVCVQSKALEEAEGRVMGKRNE